MPYDFTDEHVYSLVKGTHLPEETGGLRIENASGYSAQIEPLRLVCRKDGEDWPCAAVTQLRAFDDKRMRSTVFAPRASESDPDLSSRGTRG